MAVHFATLILDDVRLLMNDVLILAQRPLYLTDVFDATRIVRLDASVLAGSYAVAYAVHYCSMK